MGQRTRQGRPAQQRAHQPGAGRIGDALEFIGLGGGGGQRCSHQRQQALDMIARGQFRHYAAVQAMQVDLAKQLVREQPALAVQHGHRAFVTGRLDGQDSHGYLLACPYGRVPGRPWGQDFAFCRQPL